MCFKMRLKAHFRMHVISACVYKKGLYFKKPVHNPYLKPFFTSRKVSIWIFKFKYFFNFKI